MLVVLNRLKKLMLVVLNRLNKLMLVVLNRLKTRRTVRIVRIMTLKLMVYHLMIVRMKAILGWTIALMLLKIKLNKRAKEVG